MILSRGPKKLLLLVREERKGEERKREERRGDMKREEEKLRETKKGIGYAIFKFIIRHSAALGD